MEVPLFVPIASAELPSNGHQLIKPAGGIRAKRRREQGERGVGTDGAAQRVAGGHRVVAHAVGLEQLEHQRRVGRARQISAVEAPLVSKRPAAAHRGGEFHELA